MTTWQFSKQLASITSSLLGGTTEFEIRYRKAKGNPCIESEPYLVPKYKKKQNDFNKSLHQHCCNEARAFLEE